MEDRTAAPLDVREEQALAELKELLKLNFAHIESLSKRPAEILPHLLLGSKDDATDLKVLGELGVTHVLNCASGTVRTGAGLYAPMGIAYSEFVAEDCQGYNIMQHYDLLVSLAD
ncbi:unnamed protein product, partial [Polarella glacialis]